MRPAAITDRIAIAVLWSAAAWKNSSSLKKPTVSGSALNVAAAIALTAASSGSSRHNPPTWLSLLAPVAIVTVPAVRNSADFASACATT